MRTFGAQYGISLPQMQSLPEMLSEPLELNPIAVQLLMNPTDKMYSAMFAAAWATMRGLRNGDLSFSIAESRLSKNPWTMHFPLPELLSSCLASAPARGLVSDGTAIEMQRPIPILTCPRSGGPARTRSLTMQ